MKTPDNNICPTTNRRCDDECCPSGSVCNLGSDELKSAPLSVIQKRIAYLEGMETVYKDEIRTLDERLLCAYVISGILFCALAIWYALF